MKRLIYLLLIVIWPIWASADDIAPALPALYDVIDVAPDDRLNVRLLPTTDAPIIEILGHNATNVEVVALSKQGNWGYVTMGEIGGWVSLRFLQRQQASKNYLGLPPTLYCFGTEPFWTITFQADAITISRPEGTETYPIVTSSPSLVETSVSVTGFRFEWQNGDNRVRGHILPGLCSDGMSETVYGLHYVDTFLPNAGCCGL